RQAARRPQVVGRADRHPLRLVAVKLVPAFDRGRLDDRLPQAEPEAERREPFAVDGADVGGGVRLPRFENTGLGGGDEPAFDAYPCRQIIRQDKIGPRLLLALSRSEYRGLGLSLAQGLE